jgi:hypothetical protein
MHKPVRDAAKRYMRHIGPSAGAKHHHSRIIFVGHRENLSRHVPEISLADGAIGRDPGRPQIGDSLGNEAFALPFRAIYLEPAEPADSKLMYVQDNDLVASVLAQLTGHRDRCGDMTLRDMPCRVYS